MTIAQLAKKVDEQSRFTRSVSLMCTFSILAVMFYTLTEMNSHLPQLVLLQFMGNMEKVVLLWKECETSISTRRARGQSPLTGPMR